MPIAITVDSLGNIIVTPQDPAPFNPGANVEWTVTGCTNTTVTFNNGATPFNDLQLNVPGVSTIPSGTLNGNYHYTVSALVQGVPRQTQPPAMDPEIIVGAS